MMSRCPAPCQQLTATRALYIGRAAPTSTYEGLDSIQKPLCELYRKSKWDPKKIFDHMESNLYVFRSGLLMKPVNPLDKDVWFKIQDLESCSAVKAYNDPSCRGRLLFVPSDSGSARMSEHPSVFALIMKRSTGGIKVTDCHAFICHSDSDALTLVRAAAGAFSDPSGWSDERPTLVELGLERPEVKFDNECYVDDFRDDCTAEYYDKPKLSGFFYTPRTDLIQKYNVKGEDCYGRPISNGCPPVEPFICDEFEPPARAECPPAPQTALIVLQNGGHHCCSDDHCSPKKKSSSKGSSQTVTYRQSSSQQYAIAPQQAQIMYGGTQMGDWRSKDKNKKDKRATNHYVQQSEMFHSSPQPYIDPNGDQYLVDEQAQMYGGQAPGGYVAMQNGMGDYGPPQDVVEYVEYHGNRQVNGEMDLYSRQLPGQGRAGGGRNYDGNFMLKQGGGYGVPGGYGMNMGALSIGDQY